MWEKIRNAAVAHIIGFALLGGGWLLAVNYVGFTMRMNPTMAANEVIYSGTSIVALVMILLGAYFPEIWLTIMNRRKQGE